MKVVVDTNILVSGLLSPHGAPAEVLRMIVSGEVELCVDARIISEYEEVLARPKFGFDKEEIGLLIDYIKHSSLVVTASPLKVRLEDTGDEPFAEVSVSGRAACLITGNVKHFPSRALKNIKALTAGKFLAYYRSFK